MKIAGTVVLVILLVLVWGSWFLSKSDVTHIEREIYVNAQPGQVKSELEEDDLLLTSPWNKEIPASRIKAVSFKDFGTVYFTEIKIEQEGKGTRVKLIFDADNESAWTRASWFFRRAGISKEYEAGLLKLKIVVESRK
ncbi:MAG: hypothetical protein ABJA70_07150 [Chryseolinea sp.]